MTNNKVFNPGLITGAAVTVIGLSADVLINRNGMSSKTFLKKVVKWMCIGTATGMTVNLTTNSTGMKLLASKSFPNGKPKPILSNEPKKEETVSVQSSETESVGKAEGQDFYEEEEGGLTYDEDYYRHYTLGDQYEESEDEGDGLGLND